MKLAIGIIIGAIVMIGGISLLNSGSSEPYIDQSTLNRSYNSEYSLDTVNDEYEKKDSSGCTVDCSGHNAGYNWASDKGHTRDSQCTGNSQSFIEGCLDYVNN